MGKESDKETREWSWDNTGHRAVETNVIVRLLGGRTENFLFLDFYGDLVCGTSTPWTGLEQAGQKELTMSSPPMAFLPTNTCDLQSSILEDKEGPEGRAIVGKGTPLVVKAVGESCFILKRVLGPCYAYVQPGKKKQLFWGPWRTFSNGSY